MVQHDSISNPVRGTKSVMIPNPFVLKPSFTSEAQNKNVPRVDTDNGRSTFRLNLGLGHFREVTVSHAISKENKSVLTDRHLVRIDSIKPDATGLGTIRASVQLVIAHPRADYTNEDMNALCTEMIRFLFEGNEIDEFGANIPAYAATIQSLLNGETGG